jgi:hypothetical protein
VRRNARDVFINIPFDARGEKTFLALIAALVALGLTPRSVVEIPTQQPRLERLFQLISQCPYSIHDLSRTGLSTNGGFRVPRFNMPFELGLAVALSLTLRGRNRHEWWVFETTAHRLPVSLSDLAGYDCSVYEDTVAGLFRAVAADYGI